MLCKPFFCAPLCIRNGFLFKGACFTLFSRAVLPCICLPQNRMSVRVMVRQCAAVLSSAAGEFAFSKAAELQSRVSPFELCRGMCPFRVMHAHKCNGCQNTNQPWARPVDVVYSQGNRFRRRHPHLELGSSYAAASMPVASLKMTARPLLVRCHVETCPHLLTSVCMFACVKLWFTAKLLPSLHSNAYYSCSLFLRFLVTRARLIATIMAPLQTHRRNLLLIGCWLVMFK